MPETTKPRKPPRPPHRGERPADGARRPRPARSCARTSGPRGQAGISLIEVVVATLMAALCALATLSAFDTATRASADQRRHAQATQIAQQDEERLRGLTATEIGQLGSGSSRTVGENGTCVEQVSGKWQYCSGTSLAGTTYSGTVFTVTSSARYVSASNEGFTCETTGASADYLETTSSVSWTALGTRPPVTQSSLVTNPVKGALLVKVKNQNNEAVSGATVTATGTTTNDSQTTSSSGCVIFGGISDSELTTSVSDSGYVDHQGKSPPPSKTASISSTSMAESEFVIAPAGSLQAEFTSNGISSGVTSDTFTASYTGIASPPYMLGGTAAATASSYFSSVTLGSLFPFEEGSKYQKYSVYAGDCVKNNPQEVAGIKPGEEVVEPNKVNKVKVEVPAITVVVKNVSGGSLVTSTSAKIINSECSSATAQNVSGTVPYEHVVSVKGGALEPKYQPYAKELKLCVVFKEGSEWFKNTFPLTNTKKEGTSAGEKFVKSGSYTHSTSELKC